jgi:hypothetical protein
MLRVKSDAQATAAIEVSLLDLDYAYLLNMIIL